MFLRTVLRKTTPLSRHASTQARGLEAILQKKPDDVVITFAARTAMGRVRKGQLKDHPVDEMLLALFKVESRLTCLIQSVKHL